MRPLLNLPVSFDRGSAPSLRRTCWCGLRWATVAPLVRNIEAPKVRGVNLLEEALIAVGETDSADRARVLARLGSVRSWPDAVSHEDDSLNAVTVARRVGDPRALADALVSRYYGLTIEKSRDEAMILCQEVEVLATDLQSAVLMMDSKR